MKISRFRRALEEHPAGVVVLVLPDGEPIPAGFHVTEVGHVARNFIDCGGTVRRRESCLMQAWVPEGGLEAPLSAGKLARILDLSRRVLPARDLDVELEYGGNPLGHFKVSSVDARRDQIVFRLAHKKTDCLARGNTRAAPAGCGCNPAGNPGACC